MPYANATEVPKYVPQPKRKQWLKVWNSAYDRGLKTGKGPEVAEQLAFAEANGVAVPNSTDKTVFIQFTKVDAVKREVYGVVTAERPDKEDEVCDYEKSKPYYQALVDEMTAATEKTGVGKNIFPLREMHTMSAVGRGILIEFRDEAKEIYMGFKVEDDRAWKFCETGVYTGFSHGGKKVGKMVPDPTFKGCLRYVAKPAEMSVVDNPCLKDAHFEYVKCDGSTELRKFQTRRESARKEGVMDNLMRLVKALIDRKIEARRDKLGKGMYEVARLADLLQSLCYLRVRAQCEADCEEDESEIPSMLQGNLEELIDTFLGMAEEEARELAEYAANQAEGAMYMSVDVNGLAKAVHKGMAAHFKKSAAHYEKTAGFHQHLAKAHEDAADGLEGEDSKIHKALNKAASRQHEAIAKAHAAHADHLKGMAAENEAAEKAVDDEIQKATTAALDKSKEDDKAKDAKAAAATDDKAKAAAADGKNKAAATDDAAKPDDMKKAVETEMQTAMAGLFKETMANFFKSDEAKTMAQGMVKGMVGDLMGKTIEPTKAQLIMRPGAELSKGAQAEDSSSTGL